MLVPLPVDAAIAPLREVLRERRAAVLVAAPGAGKTTRVPPALADAGSVLVLQPRRAAARALARRVADERGWTLGREVGWHVRFEPRFSRETRVVFATEGILTARLQQDPLLSDVTTLILDEFHERSVHADLGLALARQAWLARDDIRLVVMSATIDPRPVAAFLDDCPVLEVPGDPHPLTIEYEPETRLPAVVDRIVRERQGNVLVFLPGAREIDEALRDVRGVASRHGIDVCPLHGALPPEAQDEVLTPAATRRIVLATNIAETSVTVPGVRTVIDSGWQKVARHDPARAIDTLQTERVTADAAAQRAGRAARLGPGLAVRLWHEHDRLRAVRTPEILAADLAPVLLAIAAWGGDERTFEWFETPPVQRQQDARRLLTRLGAIGIEGLTTLGRTLARLPLPPRLARMVIEADFHPDVCLMAALLADARVPAPDGHTTDSDLLSLLPAARNLAHLRRAAEAIARTTARDTPHSGRRQPLDDDSWCRAVLTGFPDRVAQRRSPQGDALLLATGTGARLSPASGVRNAAYLVALDVRGIEGREAVVHLASRVDRDWLAPTHVERRASVDEAGRLRVVRTRRYDALTLDEQAGTIEPDDRQALATAWRERARSDGDAGLLARLAFAGLDVDVDALVATAAAVVDRLGDIDIEAALPWSTRQRLLTDAPLRLPLPSGRTTALAYLDDGSVRAAVKLQELFGLGDTPRIGPRQVPVVFELLAPNGRPVQTTQDLRSFWTTTYAEVRKELRGRYPKHAWPEKP